MKTGPKKQFIASPSKILQQVTKTFLPIEMSDARGADSINSSAITSFRLMCKSLSPLRIITKAIILVILNSRSTGLKKLMVQESNPGPLCHMAFMLTR